MKAFLWKKYRWGLGICGLVLLFFIGLWVKPKDKQARVDAHFGLARERASQQELFGGLGDGQIGTFQASSETQTEIQTETRTARTESVDLSQTKLSTGRIDQQEVNEEGVKFSDKEGRYGKAEDPRPVYLVGAVQKPGIYFIGKKRYLYELIEEAGGLTDEADANSLNLAAPIQALKRYVIVKKGERPNGVRTAIEPMDWNDALDLDADEPVGLFEEKAVREGASREDMAFAGQAGGEMNGARIHLNRATASDLARVPGIGPKTAERIVDYRKAHGLFHKVEDLLNIKGIKEKKLEQMRPYLTLGE